LLDLHKNPSPELASYIAEFFTAHAIAIYDADLDTLESRGSWPVNAMELAKSTCLFEVDQDDVTWHLSRRVLRLGKVPIGALLIRGDLNPLTIDAIASLVSMTFDRYRGFTNQTRAEAARQTEQFRTAVLDRLAHTFKTPLTVIRTASEGLLELSGLSPAHRDLTSLIDEQSILLNELATRLLRTARLEPDKVSPQKEKVAIADVIHDVVGSRADMIDGHALDVAISDNGLSTWGDRELLSTIVRQFVDNAVKYSYPSTRISISVEECASEIILAVHNEGEPIPTSDRHRVFDRYYRSPATEHLAKGTGIGLSIAKKAAEAHNGHVWVISDPQLGTTFYLSVSTVKGGMPEHSEP
jgi:two-component system, OmpR family, sensor histidine kinase KdpD